MREILIGCLLALGTGCIGLTGGTTSVSKTGYSVESRLMPGMTWEQVQAILGDGGALLTPDEFIRGPDGTFSPSREESAAELESALGEFDRSGAESLQVVHRVVVQGRGSGFFGFDVFYLFFDEAGGLVVHTWRHFN